MIELTTPFLESTKNIIKEMTNIDVNDKGNFEEENKDIPSYGVTSIISFAGKAIGRLIIDMEPGVATEIARTLTGEEYSSLKEPMLLASISEVNNIIAGDANTFLNNKYKLGLRLAPPIVMTGKNVIIAMSKIKSSTVYCITDYGKLKINIGFEGGDFSES